MFDIDYDMPKIMWTNLMRQELLLRISKINDEIQQNWNNQHRSEIKIMENISFWKKESLSKEIPVFPELDNNILIDEIFLKNLNKKPQFDENVK